MTAVPPQLLALLTCPAQPHGQRCNGPFRQSTPAAIVCENCGFSVPAAGGVPVFNPQRPHYDPNYQVRTRASDIAENNYAQDSQRLRNWTAQFQIAGPSLDVGCGTAVLADSLPDYVGLDYSLTALTGEGTQGLSLVCGVAEVLPFASAAFGCVFSVNALEHVPAVDRAFEEIHRVLRPGGLVILHPSWHSTRYNTELIPIKPYRELNLRQKIVKAALPILRSRPWKVLTRIPPRIARRLLARRPTALHFTPLVPNFSQWIADADAAASIDSHEGILFFESRGYECLSHPTVRQKILAGHDWVLMRKPRTE